MEEARYEDTEHGRRIAGEGWAIVNLRRSAALRHSVAGAFVNPEPRAAPWPDFGLNVHVLMPGEPNGKYHSESVQEGFLVLDGDCLAIIEGQERRLGPWDYVHCPAGTEHIFVGAGDGPCRILMVGARRPDATVHYPVSDLAARYRASSPSDTSSPAEAYADWNRDFRTEPAGQLLG